MSQIFNKLSPIRTMERQIYGFRTVTTVTADLNPTHHKRSTPNAGMENVTITQVNSETQSTQNSRLNTKELDTLDLLLQNSDGWPIGLTSTTNTATFQVGGD